MQPQPQFDPFAEITMLQQLYLASQISKQLHAREVREDGLAQRMIEVCKRSAGQEQFVHQVGKMRIAGMGENFMISLYHTIKQKLPSQIQGKVISSINQSTIHPSIQQMNEHVYQSHPIPSPTQAVQPLPHPPAHLTIVEHGQQSTMSKIFPGLSIPDKDEIELDLDGMEQKVQQQMEQKAEEKRKESDKESQRKKQRDRDMDRNRDNERDKDRDRERSRSRDKNKANKHRNKQRQSSRSNSYQREHKKGKKHKHDKQQKYSHHKHYDKHQKHTKRHHSSDSEEPQVKQQYQQNRQHKRRVPSPQVTIPVQVNTIHHFTITSVTKTGAFLSLPNSTLPALLHHSLYSSNPVSDLSAHLRVGQKVYCKIIQILQTRIRVTMIGVSQSKDANRQRMANAAEIEKDRGILTGIRIEKEDQVDQEGHATSYNDLWESSRMSYMGAVKSHRKPFNPVKEDIQEINIEVNDREPPFLTGQTTKTGINLSPVRVIKNPQGTLNRQALNAAQYAKERRQLRSKENKAEVRDLTKILQEVTPRPEYRKQIRRNQMTIKQQKESLPIFSYKKQLVQACIDNNLLIIIGQTGSGKTTQITQYLYEAGFAKRGKIGCTQPRRVAAMSVAKRVCEQMDVKLGEQVGYSIRFEDHTSSKTLIKYMTDGMLLRQALMDKYLSQYSVIMLDEAHERTINTDVLFGILKKVVQKRKDFLLIVTSATLQAKKFSSYFFDCKIFSIPGRTYNVEILYAKDPQTDYLDASLMCVMQIHVDQPPGDILLFLTGQEQIDTACQILGERLKKMGEEIPELIILPVYSALPSQLQTKIFEPAPKGKRKCVIATNIAEASLTIDGIFYVVDPGFAKIKIYNSKLGMDSLVVAPISQASAKQRAGRAGRTGPGKCYRIYTEEAYRTEMLPTSVPQIQRANLSNTVLQLKAMGINDLINFDFMDAPPVQTLIVALQQLYYLSALDDEGLLTKLGRKMAEFPLQPTLSKMLLTSIDFGCTQQIVTIIAMLSVQNIFYRPKEKESIADQKKTKFNHHQGDHLTYLAVYEGWKQQEYSASWCRDNYIQQRSLKRAQDVKQQILQLLGRYRFQIRSCGGNYSLIRKTIVSGFFFHAAKKDPKGGYRTLIDDHQVYIHPSSSLFNKQPQWVIYHELVFTTKEYMRDVCTINPKWLIDVAPNYFKFTDELGFTRKKRNEKLDPLDQKYGDPNAWRLSKRKG